MLVLHAIWDNPRFYLWAESSALPLKVQSSRGRQPKKPKPRSHPFSVPGEMLHDEIAAIFGQMASGTETKIFALPGSKREPVPSPWLIRDDRDLEKTSGLLPWYIDTLIFDPHAAFNLLLDLPVHPPHGIVFGRSLQFWIVAARFSLEIIAREQFAPTVKDGDALWVPVIDEEDQNRVQTLSMAIPPICLAFEEQSRSRKKSRQIDESNPQKLVMSFINQTVDSFVRRSIRIKKTRLDPSLSYRQPEIVPLPHQFLQALVDEDPAIKAASPNAPFRTCFRLVL